MYQRHFTAKTSAKHSIKRQVDITHVRAVGWEAHGSSPTACAGRADQELP